MVRRFAIISRPLAIVEVEFEKGGHTRSMSATSFGGPIDTFS